MPTCVSIVARALNAPVFRVRAFAITRTVCPHTRFQIHFTLSATEALFTAAVVVGVCQRALAVILARHVLTVSPRA